MNSRMQTLPFTSRTRCWLHLCLALLCLHGGVLSAADDEKPENRRLNQLNRAEIDDGWISLFDGHSMFGWKANNTSVNWQIKDGIVWADAGDPGLLVTTTEFNHFELKCDFRLSKSGNSGVFLRSLFTPKDPAVDCYELNVCDSHPGFPTGSLVGVVKADTPSVGEGEWKTFHVRVEGSLVQVKLDGKTVLDYTEKRPNVRQRGFIGLQKNAGKAEYRNIFLKPLVMASRFNRENLSGWTVVPGSKSQFTAEEETIRIKNGPGFLYSAGSGYKDFVFQTQVKTNGKGLNSGIFFRSMPPTEKAPSNGYELQIQNGFKDDDRTKPADFGTGAIYRRVPARRVVSNDFEWFNVTLVAVGAHFSVWVDGEMVTDWTDDRKPDENPRKGLRTDYGPFILQGHDPTTDVQFRKMFAGEYLLK